MKNVNIIRNEKIKTTTIMGYKLYTKKDYAALKGVHKSRITHLKGKLKSKINKYDMEEIYDCPSNDKLFLRPSYMRGEKKVIKPKSE